MVLWARTYRLLCWELYNVEWEGVWNPSFFRGMDNKLCTCVEYKLVCVSLPLGGEETCRLYHGIELDGVHRVCLWDQAAFFTRGRCGGFVVPHLKNIVEIEIEKL